MTTIQETLAERGKETHRSTGDEYAWCGDYVLSMLEQLIKQPHPLVGK